MGIMKQVRDSNSLFWKTAAVAMIPLAYFAGMNGGERRAFDRIAAIADDLEHQNAFGACLVERWEQDEAYAASRGGAAED